ncbi:MAG: tRNA (guanosine(46)-N7)-methyltransferase TrmB [Clostridia bacterium]|nr:tRNA (guanosine(46)-N7)-methyltransferase TrmB [Clostridia bacterium]
MRKKKHGAERIAACADLLIADPSVLLTDPQSPFGTARPLCLEIGCGKGAFACGTAAAQPDINLIAMERVADVACIALERAAAERELRPGDNLRFIIGNAQNLSEWFPEHCLDRIYLNFSDPWPKAGYAKRRLTHVGFLEQYRRALKTGGVLLFKTDNVALFDFSLEQFDAAGLEVLWQTRDLHNSPYGEGNIMTEYESNFTVKGFTINAAAVRFDKKAD